MAGQVADKVKKERSRKMLALARKRKQVPGEFRRRGAGCALGETDR